MNQTYIRVGRNVNTDEIYIQAYEHVWDDNVTCDFCDHRASWEVGSEVLYCSACRVREDVSGHAHWTNLSMYRGVSVGEDDGGIYARPEGP
jgi:hypothetical protein